MVLKFNPPPDWPEPPSGWEPPPGWSPDPSWPPMPDGWRLWVDHVDPQPISGGPDELITLDNLTVEHLYGVLSNAYMNVFIDEGDLGVREGCVFWVMPSPEYRRVKLVAYYGFTETSTEMERLACANQINYEYIMVQAAVMGDRLRFSYDIPLDAPMTRRLFASIVKRFSQIPPEAVGEFGKEIID